MITVIDVHCQALSSCSLVNSFIKNSAKVLKAPSCWPGLSCTCGMHFRLHRVFAVPRCLEVLRLAPLA